MRAGKVHAFGGRDRARSLCGLARQRWITGIAIDCRTCGRILRKQGRAAGLVPRELGDVFATFDKIAAGDVPGLALGEDVAGGVHGPTTLDGVGTSPARDENPDERIPTRDPEGQTEERC